MTDPAQATARKDAASPPTTDAPTQPALGPAGWRVSVGKRIGRGHRARGEPCQDAFASHVDPDLQRVVAAVADGLGSRPRSHLGSQAACDAAVATLAAEPAWDRDAMLRAFGAARQAVAQAAATQGLALDDLATTLQVAAMADGRLLAAMVGDGAIVAGDPAATVLAPPTAGYANEVVPLTASAWADHVQVAEMTGGAAAPSPVLLFSDGLTRLLLARGRTGWTPFAPFFETFLPRVQASLDPGLAQRFLDADHVDRSWDDDKCLVVIARMPREVGQDA